MTADLACDALRMAIFRRKRPKCVIVHSDRGSQYCSYAYRQLLQQHQLLGSMSAKGNCYDNACAESFIRSRSKPFTVSDLTHVKACGRRYLNTSKPIQSRQTTLNQWLFKSG
ncbi:Mobile element protein [Methylomonas albis]|nr:Mobile element protein [Methylomonas albis]